MGRGNIILSLLLATGLAVVAVLVVPRGYEAGRLLASQNDPEQLADLELRAFDAAAASREIEAALAADDAELARSFVDLAGERAVAIDPALVARVEAAATTEASGGHQVASFAHGFVTGEPEDFAGLAGTALGDLFIFGDVRDLIREGTRLARGEEANRLVLGLSVGGLAITAGTLVSAGLAAPARVGLSVVKTAGKTGRIGVRLARVLAVESSESLIKLAGDVGRVQSKAGTRAALDGIRIAEEPRDAARLASLAVAKGGKTRAVLKLLGRAAIVLTTSLFDLVMWVLWAIASFLGFCASLKRTAEGITLRIIRWRKARRYARIGKHAAAPVRRI